MDVEGQAQKITARKGPSAALRMGCLGFVGLLLALILPTLLIFPLGIASATIMPEMKPNLYAFVPSLWVMWKGALDAPAHWLKLRNMTLVTSVALVLVGISWSVTVSLDAAAIAHTRWLRPLGGTSGESLTGMILRPAAAFLVSFIVLGIPRRVIVRVAFMVRGLIVVSAIGALALLVPACVRASVRPSAEKYAGGLKKYVLKAPGIPQGVPPGWSPPPVATIMAARQPPPLWKPGPPGRKIQQAGELQIIQECDDGYVCSVSLEDKAEVPPAEEGVRRASVPQPLDEALTLRHDERAEVVYVQLGSTPVLGEFHREEGRWCVSDFDAERVTRRVSTPIIWIYTAAGGLVIALLLEAIRRFAARDAGEPGKRTEGILGPDGVIRFEDAPALRVDTMEGLAPGPVVVNGSLPIAPDPFRSQAVTSAALVSPGTIADQRDEATLTRLRWDMAMLGVIAITAAPLVGAAIAGLVFP